jgi:hypothetical protein
MMVAEERPGVFIDYAGSGVLWNPRGGAVGIVAQGEGEAGRRYTVATPGDAEKIFGKESALARLCAAAFQNGAARVEAAVAAEESPDWDGALKLLEEAEGVRAVVTGDTTQEGALRLKGSVVRAANAGRERIGVAAYPQEDAAEAAGLLNCERMVLFAQPLKEDALPLAAAAFAGRIAAADPAAPLHGAELAGIAGPAEPPTEEEIDALVRAGITPLEERDGALQVVRAVTTRTKTGDAPDTTFRELTTILILDDVLPAVRTALKALLRGARSDKRTRLALGTRAAVVLEQKRAAGLLAGYRTPRVYPDAGDPSVCVVELAFTVAAGISRIVVSAQITV